MDQGLNKFLKTACTNQAGALVGRLCKQNEVLQEEYKQRIVKLEKEMQNVDDQTKHLTEVRISEIKKYIQDLSLLKNFNKELIYQEFRDLREAIIFYSEGRDHIKLPIYTSKTKG